MTDSGLNPGQEPGTPGTSSGTETPPTTPPQTPPPATPPLATPPSLPDSMPDLESDDAWGNLPKWVRELRNENASRRVEAKSLQDKVDEFERAQMTELQAAQADAEKFKNELTSKDTKIRELQVQVAASSAGVVDTEAVVRLLDWSKVDAGQSINEAITDLLEAKPYLKATTATPPTAPDPKPTTPPSTTATGSPGNGDNNGPAVFTRKQLDAMTSEEYEKNRDKIMEALSQGRIR